MGWARKQPRKAEAQTAGPSPYVDARRVWNDHVGGLVSARALWQVAALLNGLVALAAVGTVAKLATRARFVPYVVEVDRAGEVEAIKRAAGMAPASRAVIEAQLREFVAAARRVTTDRGLQNEAIRRVFAMLAEGDPATTKMSAHLRGDGFPFKRAEECTVTVEIDSTLPQSDETWQVDWTESVYSRDGQLKERFAMRALLTVYQSEPVATTEASLKANPFAVFVRDYSWSRRRGLEEVR